MKIVYAVVAAMMFVAAPAFAAAPAGPVTLTAKNGNITFNHATHKFDCTKCHADAQGGKMAPLGKDKGHATCLDCHKAEAKGPTKCNECHKKG